MNDIVALHFTKHNILQVLFAEHVRHVPHHLVSFLGVIVLLGIVVLLGIIVSPYRNIYIHIYIYVCVCVCVCHLIARTITMIQST